ncbi:MAG TPA: XdhC family protein [Acidimicrobiia bacterium]|jgi:xanthine dehydrogenase accessory factor|nr:XdhC family protein [Acidimicrobiia bacterium]
MSPRSGEGWRILQLADELAAKGEKFALATVVWRQAPSSGHEGARAIVTADGEIHGWIGGACAEPVVIREAQRVMAEGEPQLILLGAPDDFGHVPEGMLQVPMACQSEGALQVYIEPVLSAPRLVVVGRSPMATTLVDLASILGWRAELVDSHDFTADRVERDAIVIVATQGHDDEDTLERAVTADPAFVGLVASRKRGEAVLGYLADRGLDRESLQRVRFPVGVDLGHTTHNEIAVSVLAELVSLRAKGELERTATAVTEPPATAIDLVCGMTVPADETSRPFVYQGTTYYFCAPGCRTAFEKNPTAYL